MTQEDKELLLKDLCARLPYDVEIQIIEWATLDTTLKTGHIARLLNNDAALKQIKPYLFPLSSMTEEQRKEYHELLYNPKHGINIDYFDWCYKNHLDCRGLIPKGLAIDSTGLNIY